MPQSPSATRAFGAIATAWPRTVRLPIAAPVNSPDAAVAFARACTAPLIEVACTSPPKSVSELTSAAAFAVAVCPGLAEAEATEPPQETTSALGYAPALPNATASTGAVTALVAAPAWPGTITLRAYACDVAPPSRADDSAPARPGASASGSSARAMESRLPTKRLILAQASAVRRRPTGCE